MAGDWIKMRTDLDSDPAVFHMADMLGVSEYEIVGMLHKFWSWADKHTEDGVIPTTPERIDRHINVTGFCDALATGDGKTPWLIIGEGSVVIPEFSKHNGQSAKKRAESTERQRMYRASKPKCHESVTDVSQKKCDKSVTREEKRREEIKTQSVPPSTTEADHMGSGTPEPSGGSGGGVSVECSRLATKLESNLQFQLGTQGFHLTRLETYRQKIPDSEIEAVVLNAADWLGRKCRAGPWKGIFGCLDQYLENPQKDFSNANNSTSRTATRKHSHPPGSWAPIVQWDGKDTLPDEAHDPVPEVSG